MAQNEDRGWCIKAGELAVVVGAGRSGKAAARLLVRQGARVRLLESDPQALDHASAEALRAEGIELVLGKQGPELFAGARLVVPSPGLPLVRLRELMGPHADAEGTEILAEMELAWRALDGEPVLAVTGTSGKTTTVSLAAAMLREQGLRVFLGGNIGTPLSEYLLSGEKADVLVLEVSSFQLQGCITFHPRAAVILNISPNHLDYHKDMDEYIEAKFRIFRCQDGDDLAVLAPDLEDLAARHGLRARKVWIRPENRFPDCPLFGRHNQYNAEAAWQACRLFGVTQENAARAVAAFRPLPNRLESVARVRDVLYVNDSKCTTVAALRVALDAMDRSVHLLCGGKFKGGDLEGMKELLRRKARSVNLYGASREVFEQAWQGVVPLCWHETMEQAVLALQPRLAAGDVVLLAPATSSFDQYRNYVERGNDFKRIVGSLA
ncbi:UDP-N-acetylmuramoyl-L-alanine--D-glutamate ligase [uncultured Desulfovibrio sp.]|uniref:Mur ligase family protein n=1 Tax=uncultured Desulfovibrio sp. TaxID=167968 RepID=UPI00260EF3FD|nr:UDP-N-acetylmuramoyl-L-alanine--D-glutamate ligase [uncultured Desulfovibrio sp.]